MENSIISLIEKTLKLHSLGYVHNDIKYENLGMNADGTIYLFDFDNFSEINKRSCSLDFSSNVCYPPDILVQASIFIGLGNQIIDLFSICTIILGDIIGIELWAFDNKQFYEKNQQLSNFKRNRIHDTINKKIFSKFKETCLSQIRKIAEITSYNFYILLKDTIKSLVINHKYFSRFFSFFIYI
jgi:serine/threonine protein kinase